MEQFLLPAMLAAAIGMLAWWGAIMLSAVTGTRRKLAQRLSKDDGDGRPKSTLSNLSVILPEEMATVPKFLARKPFIQVLQKKLGHAFPGMKVQRFFIISGICAFVPAIIVGLVSENPAAVCGAFAFGSYVPLFLVNFRYNGKMRKIVTQLPEGLDFLSRIMRAGHSLSTGLQMLADDLPKPLADEFRRVYEQHSLGQTLEDGLKEMAGRVESTEFSFFVTAVLIQRQTGGDLSEVLGNIAGVIRSRMRLAQGVKAKTAEGQFTGYILVAFPIAMFGICYYLNPDLYGGFAANPTGKKLLAVALGLVLMGLWAIKKITTVRV